MPQANITYNAPYNRRIVDILDEMDKKHWEKAYPAYHPNPLGFRLGSFHGEPVSQVMVGGGSSPLKYNPAGNSPAYPPHNMSAGLAVQSGGSFHQGARYSGVDGAIGGAFNPFDFGYKLGHDVIGPALDKAIGRRGRGKAPAKKGGRKLNVLGVIKDIGHAIGAPIGAVGQKLAEAELGKAVGLGRKPRAKKAPMVGLGEGGAHSGGAKKGKNARAEIVKKVMRDRGVKMIEASKIVKAEGLY